MEPISKERRVDILLRDGRTVSVPVTSSGKRSGRIVVSCAYGTAEATAGTYAFSDCNLSLKVAEILRRVRRIDRFGFEPLIDVPGKTAFVDGQKARLVAPGQSHDPSDFVYGGEGQFRSFWDRRFLGILRRRLPEEAKRGGIPLPVDFAVETGEYRGLYARYNTVSHVFQFDRRLMAFRPIVLDSVIDHELCHIVSVYHNSLFYGKLYGSLMDKKTYQACRDILTTGRFRDSPGDQPSQPSKQEKTPLELAAEEMG